MVVSVRIFRCYDEHGQYTGLPAPSEKIVADQSTVRLQLDSRRIQFVSTRTCHPLKAALELDPTDPAASHLGFPGSDHPRSTPRSPQDPDGSQQATNHAPSVQHRPLPRRRQGVLPRSHPLGLARGEHQGRSLALCQRRDRVGGQRKVGSGERHGRFVGWDGRGCGSGVRDHGYVPSASCQR